MTNFPILPIDQQGPPFQDLQLPFLLHLSQEGIYKKKCQQRTCYREKIKIKFSANALQTSNN